MTESKKNKLIFITRLISWLLIGCVVPIIVFSIKFGLFNETTVLKDELGNVITETDISLNGWGIVSCVLVGSFITTIIKEVSSAYVGYSLTKQCLKGLLSTVPLCVAFAVCYFLNGIVEELMFCIVVIVICKIVSTPLNPLPKWKFEKKGIEDYSTVTELLTNYVKTHTNRGGS